MKLFKRNCQLFRLSTFLIFSLVTIKAQSQIDNVPVCGANADFFSSLAADSTGKLLSSGPSTPLPVFASGAIFHCGSVDVYYEDINSSTGHGFDDHTLVGAVELGAIRRNTLCAVLNYIQTQFDFTTHVTSGAVRLYVQHSLDPVTNPAVIGDAFFAQGGPNFTGTAPGITGGWLNQYVTTGIDPAPSGGYHATIQVNFDQIVPLGGGGAGFPILWQNDYLSDTNCHIDLYSTLLHEMTHALGWVSFVKFSNATPGGAACGCVYRWTPAIYNTPGSIPLISPNLFSRLDTSLYASPVGVATPTSLHPLIIHAGGLYSINPAAYNAFNNYWLNSLGAPDNHPVFSGGPFDAYDSTDSKSFLSHLEDMQYSYSFRQRVSPGDRTEYVMGPFGLLGAYRRTYAKGEIQTLVRTMGYTYTGSSPSVITNHTPYSQKMGGFGITPTTYGEFSEVTPPDYTIANNIGAMLIIDLADPAFTTADLSDLNGDPITIDTTTIVNFRGCGVGGNNHAGLVWAGAHPTTITYTPRPNFYGKAQFGFNLFDGHERGSFRVVTIEVLPGTNVHPSLSGGNMVCNPGFEEGSELATAANDKIPNTYSSNQESYEGKWQGINFSDSHPYGFHSHNIYTNPAFTGWYTPLYRGTVIKNATITCSDTVITGGAETRFLSAPNIDADYDNPAPITTTGGNRYQKFQMAGTMAESYYNLDTNITQCNHFILSFDIYKANDNHNITVCTGCDANLQIKFTNVVNISAPVFNYTLPVHSFPMTTGVWKRDTLSFWYCGSPSNIMYFNNTNGVDFNIDNIALIPDPLPPPMAITLADTSIGSCQFRLYVNTFTDTGCTATKYLWAGPALSCTTCATPIATPTAVAVYTLTVTDKCGTRSATATVTVNPLVPAITGSPLVCVGTAITLTDSTTGGKWSSSSTAIATIGSSSGLLTGITAGTAIITYTLKTGCYTTVTATVVALPAAITGPSTACVGLTMTLSDATTGGSWSSANTAIATIGSVSGIVTGVATGNTTITYTVGSGCYVTKVITVNPVPAAIGGTAAVCVTATTTLTDATGSGAWSSSNTAIATVGAGTGIVTGVAAGTATISYTLSTGCPATVVFTVNPNPVISGSGSVCISMTTTLTSSLGGGTWTSGNTLIATVDSSSGIVTGVAAGTAVISYTVTGTGCIGAFTITVNAPPATISGSTSVCTGATTSFTDATGSGSWSSSNTAVATIGFGTGIATGASAGTATITYQLSTGCYTTVLLTVNPVPLPITGTASVCAGSTTTLTDATGSGTWSSANTAIATVGPGTGIVTGVASGITTITYKLGTGCFATIAITVNALPAAIGGVPAVCIGSTTTLTDATGGGSWSSGDTTVATIGSSSGIVSGISLGTATITYRSGAGCIATIVVTVTPLPAPISGTLTLCVGATTSLTDATGSGAWTSGATAVATIGLSSGIATGVSSGTAGVTYTIGTGCVATAILTVNPLPATITGSALICAGLTETLTDATGGGVWSSSVPAVATIDSVTGLVTGISAGSTTITYTLPTGCYTTFALTGITVPAPITGTLVICAGTSTMLSDATPGGAWTSGSTGIATVGPGSGIVSGISGGFATVTYSLGGTCYQTAVVTVNAAPGAYSVVGGGSYCIGGSGVHIGLAGSHTGVTYQLYLGSTPVGSPATGTGGAIDFGLITTTGVYTVMATVTATGCTGAMTGAATVGTLPLPAAITGPSSVCVGATITLADATPGGIWSSVTIPVATVGAVTGIVSGITPGTDTIRYTITSTGCSQVKVITVNPLPAPITGNLKVCLGAKDTLFDATTGGIWAVSNVHATIGSGTGILTGVSVGMDTVMYGFPATGCGVKTVIQVLDTVCAPCKVFGHSFTELSGSISSNLGAGNYYISGNVTVTGTVTFDNAIMLIAPGDTIYVDSNAVLTLDSCHLFSLCQQWQGMVLKPGLTHSGRLFVTDYTLIEDAMCAVYIPNAATPSSGDIFKSDGAIFNQNVVGLFIQHYTPNIPVYPFLVRNTVFTSRDLQTHNPNFPKQWPPTLGLGGLKNYWNPSDTFLAPFNINNTTPGLGYAYPAVYCYGGIMPTNGIRLDSVGTNTPGTSIFTGVAIPATYAEIAIGDITATGNNQYQNLFDHLRYGIFGLNSNITSVNNAFTNLFATNIGTLPGTPSGGDGIYAGETDDIVNENRLRVYTPVGSNYKNVFYDFNIGVECSNYFQVISDSTYMTNKYFGTLFGPPAGTGGYYIKTAKYDTIDISGNMINNVITGVAVWMAYDPTVRIAHVGGTSITLPSQYMGLCNINNNVIQAHPIWTAPLTTQQVSMGISYQNTVMLPPSSVTEYLNNLNINYNTIHDAYNGIYVNGYWATRGVEPYTAANTVYLRQQAHARPQYGINHTNCQNSRVYYNEVTGTSAFSDTTNNMRAYYAASNSLMDLGCNDESQIGRGFEFYLTSPGMEWHSNTMNDNAKGMVLNGAVIGPQHIGLTTMNDQWLGSWPASTAQTYVYNGANALTSPFLVAGTTVTDPTNNQGTPTRTYGFAPGSILVWPSTAIAPCLPIYSLSASDTSNLLSQIAMQHVDYTLNTAPSNWMGQYALWKSTRMDTTLVDSSAVIAKFVVMADSMSRFRYLTDIEYALGTGDLATANSLLGLNIDSMANTASDSATQVKMADDITADGIVNNYQQFYSLYIKYVTGTMAGTDSLAIMALAQLCPERNGTIVFQARALYSNIYGDLSMFNDDSCLSADTSYVAERNVNHNVATIDSGNVMQRYALYPNPNDGSFMLQQDVPDAGLVAATILDAVGRVLYVKTIQFANAKSHLNLGNYAPGIYLLELKDTKNRMFRFKFVISK